MKRFGMMPLLLAGAAMGALRREGEQPGSEGGPAPTGVGTPAPAPQEEAPAQEAPASTDRPAAWPEGVNSWEEFGKLSPEDQAKAYAPKEAAPAPAEPLTEEKQGILTASLEGVSAEMAPKVSPFVEKFIRNGTLTDAEVTEAAKATGFSEAMVRQYMANGDPATVQNRADATTAPVFELVGGQENYAGFQAWANEALGPDDHAKINAALGLGEGKDADKINVDALREYTEAYMASGRGPAPRDVTSAAAAVSNQSADTDVFGSKKEMTDAINNPKYKTDPAYRSKVEAKIARSDV